MTAFEDLKLLPFGENSMRTWTLMTSEKGPKDQADSAESTSCFIDSVLPLPIRVVEARVRPALFLRLTVARW